MASPGDIIVIVVKERNEKTGRIEEIVSHGIDFATDRNIVLPQESPSSVGARFDPDIGEYVIKGQYAAKAG